MIGRMGITVVGVTSYQQRVEKWLEACFPLSVRSGRAEPTHRFLEVAFELAQANSWSRDDTIAFVNYAFGRPKGSPQQEVGGVMVTLASLHSTSEIHVDKAGNDELARNWAQIHALQTRQQSKPHSSSLPQ